MSDDNGSKHPKTRKAIDWLAACFIRLPALIFGIGIIFAAAFGITILVAPDNADKAIEILRGILKK